MPLKNHHQQEEHWIPLSDLMTGLMMFFMLIALSFMLKVEADTQKVKQIAVLYDRLRIDLYNDLEIEFRQDLPKWGAELDKDLTVRFKEPDVLFNTGSDELKAKYRTILEDFFPRYVKILTSTKYRESIQEVRIEGHTSSIWGNQVSTDEAYIRNMELSQARTRSTLQYILNIPQVQNEKKWLRKFLTANGLSSSKIVLQASGSEDPARSQRVEFRVKTNAEARIADIIETVR